MPDVVVVGAGPNGLAAAITCAEAGRRCSSSRRRHDRRRDAHGRADRPGFAPRRVLGHPPARRRVPVLRAPPTSTRHGLELVHPEVALAHPLDGGRAGVLHRRVEATRSPAWGRRQGVGPPHRLGGSALGRPGAGDARPAASACPAPAHHGRLRRCGRCCRPPWLGRPSRTEEATGLFAGAAAHSFLPLRRPLTTAPGLMLLASGPRQPAGPPPRAARRRIADAMAALLAELGGEIETGPTRAVARRRAGVARRALRRHPAPAAAHLRRRPPRPLPPAARRVPLRPGGVQGRLRPVGARAVDEPRRPTGRIVHLGGTLRGDRGRRGRRRRRPPPRATLRARGASRASSTRRGRRPASTRSGPTATCPTAPPST